MMNTSNNATNQDHKHATVLAGIPQTNLSLFHSIRFSVGDPTVYIKIDDGPRILILRDIEIERARQSAHADEFYSPADFAPEDGLSGDRETATAQSLAQCLRNNKITHVTSDRTLPLIYAHMMEENGIELTCDLDLGVLERRSKDKSELAHLRDAQSITEEVMTFACQLILKATADSDDQLIHDGQPLTSEHMISLIDIEFLKRGASTPHGSIVACGPIGSDCHHRGAGTLHTSQPIIIDIFPHIRKTGYNGDCTRTIVHGTIPPEVAKMHAAVSQAKDAAQRATKPGATGEDVHLAVVNTLKEHGFSTGLPTESDPDEFCSMTHGTGHGIGLDVHEPPLLDYKGPELVVGDVITIEPGLYCKAVGGLRIEDMVAVTDSGYENFNKLPTTLQW
jgi:Xaa-Pro aminopeptidase